MAHPHGTCVSLEVNSVRNLAEYFKICYRGDVHFELKGVNITVAEFQSSIERNASKSDEHLPTCQSTIRKNAVICTESCVVYIYSICFSTIKSCKYWNDLKLDAVIENVMLLYNQSQNIGHGSCATNINYI